MYIYHEYDYVPSLSEKDKKDEGDESDQDTSGQPAVPAGSPVPIPPVKADPAVHEGQDPIQYSQGLADQMDSIGEDLRIKVESGDVNDIVPALTGLRDTLEGLQNVIIADKNLFHSDKLTRSTRREFTDNLDEVELFIENGNIGEDAAQQLTDRLKSGLSKLADEVKDAMHEKRELPPDYEERDISDLNLP